MSLVNTARATALFEGLAGRGVTDDDVAELTPHLLAALKLAPDADMALEAFARWFSALSAPAAYRNLLMSHSAALDIFCIVAGSSALFADMLVHQPELFDILADPHLRDSSRSAPWFIREISELLNACRMPELKIEALRRWKAREMLRIGARDLAGLTNMSSAAMEFSNLADAAVGAALSIACNMVGTECLPQVAVIAMGKLGGRELNYASDIDLIFVSGDNLPATTTTADGRVWETSAFMARLCETINRVLTGQGTGGTVFRVDLRLRPEGRFGPIVRSVASYKSYFESWAETWERQAMLKARFVAGARTVAESFFSTISPFVFASSASGALLLEMEENKRRIENKAHIQGEWFTNVKTGFGGIRDVEFIVQRLQLIHAGRLHSLRTPNTLAAIRRLQRARLISEEDAAMLTDNYVFLRNVEHRLQLVHGHQTQVLPTEEQIGEWRLLARSMNLPDIRTFREEFTARTTAVHQALDRLFYHQNSHPTPVVSESQWDRVRDLLDAMDTAGAREILQDKLRAAGFTNVDDALVILSLAVEGNQFGRAQPENARTFKLLAPELLRKASATPDPDAALAGYDALAQAHPNRSALDGACLESPDMFDRLLAVAGGSPHLMQLLVRHQEWTEVLLNPEVDPGSLPVPPSGAPKDSSSFYQWLARWILRERMVTAAQDIWGEVTAEQVQLRLTEIADLAIGALLAHQPDKDNVQICIVGLGKIGGAEPGYASDWDVVTAYDGRKAACIDASTLAQGIVESVLADAHAVEGAGAAVNLDMRLRPWGSDGLLCLTPHAYARYHHRGAEIWERQAALKARRIAGNVTTGNRLVRVLKAAACGREFTALDRDTVIQMKKRIETERLQPDFRYSDLKLGYGGLSDIEWLTQLLQLQFARKYPAICHSNTIVAMSQIAECGLLDHAEADTLCDAYRLLYRVRNACWLYTGAAQDTIPEVGKELVAIARLLGYLHSDGNCGNLLQADLRATMATVRAIFVRRFYQGSAPV